MITINDETDYKSINERDEKIGLARSIKRIFEENGVK
jgi:hypothetical protein